jgi:hypothetical protein
MAIILDGNIGVTYPDVTTQNTSAVIGGKLPTTRLPAGAVLQVVSANHTTQVEGSFASVTDLMSASITPTSASSKILVLVSANGLGVRSIVTYWNGYIVRGSTAIAGFCNYLSQVDQGWWGASLSYLDSPATTSSTTYTLRGVRQGGTDNCLFNVTTGTAGTGTVSNITLMEIAA